MSSFVHPDNYVLSETLNDCTGLCSHYGGYKKEGVLFFFQYSLTVQEIKVEIVTMTSSCMSNKPYSKKIKETTYSTKINNWYSRQTINSTIKNNALEK